MSEGRLDAWLRRRGLQPRPLRALLGALVLMDLRSAHYARATGVKPEEALPPLFWVTGQLLLVSFLSCALLLGRVDARAFALCGLAVAALCTFSAVVVGFDEVALDPRDRGILGPRPLSARTYAAARLANLSGYVALIGAALTICPALSGAFLRDAGLAWLPAYALASLAVCVASAAAAVLVILLAARGGRRLDGAKAALAWIQIAIFLAVAYGGQIVLRSGGGALEEWAASPPPAVTWTPLDLLARAVAWTAWEGPSPRAALALGGALAGALGLSYLALLGLTRAYVHLATGPLQTAPLPAPATPGTLVGPLARRLLGRERGLGLWWLATHFRRDAALRLRTWPPLTLALAAAGLGALSERAQDPFLIHDERSALPLLSLALLTGALPQLCLALRSGEDPEASWLLETAPACGARFLSGVRLGLLAWTVYPALLGLGLAFAWSWRDPLHALLAILPAWLGLELGARWALLRVLGGLPFRESLARGGSLRPAALPTALLTGAAGGLAAAQFLAARSLGATLGLCALLALALPFASRAAHRAWALRLRSAS